MVGYRADGALEFSGHDVRAFGTAGYEYEYVIVVASDQFDAVRRALGVAPDADVLSAVLGRVGDIMPGGEAAWLTRHGVRFETTVWSSPPD